MVKLPDPKSHADWEIAQAAELQMQPIYDLADGLGILREELLPHGNYVAKVDYQKILHRLAEKPDAKYIDVTATSLSFNVP
jgi:formyltetrahydrofolate synthetase